MTRAQAAERYEQQTLNVIGYKAGGRVRVISVTEAGKRFVTAMVQRVNKDGSIDKRDAFPREFTFQYEAVEIEGGSK